MHQENAKFSHMALQMHLITPEQLQIYNQKCPQGHPLLSKWLLENQYLSYAQIESVYKNYSALAQTQNQISLKTTKEFGRYKILKTIGQGGMGCVYKAFDPVAKRQVAIKTLLSDKASSISKERFWREAKVMASLKHPNIINIYDMGEEQGQLYLVMELIFGPTLKEIKDDLDILQSVKIVIEIAQAIEYAHSQGIIHRDLKPANVIMANNTTPVVMDFGLAKISKVGKKLSKTGVVMGTLQYMAPEQADGRIREISAETDTYALGAILYELLTKNLPYKGQSMAQYIRHILLTQPKPLREIDPNISEDLQYICLKALAKEKHQRYATAQFFAFDLALFVEGKKVRTSKKQILPKILLLAAFLSISFFIAYIRKAPVQKTKILPQKTKILPQKTKTLSQKSKKPGTLLEQKLIAITISPGNGTIEVQKTPQGNIVLMAHFNQAPAFKLDARGKDVLFVKYAQKKHLFVKHIKAENGLVNCTAFAITKMGNIVAMVRFAGEISFQDKDFDNFIASKERDDALVFYDADGSLLEALHFRQECSIDHIKAIDNDVLIVGTISKKVKFAPEFEVTSQGRKDIFVARYSDQGEVVKVFTIGGKGNEQVKALSVLPSGNICIVGKFTGNISFTNINKTLAGQGYFVAEYSLTGKCLSAKKVAAKNFKNDVKGFGKVFLLYDKSKPKQIVYINRYHFPKKVEKIAQITSANVHIQDIALIPNQGFLVTGHFNKDISFTDFKGKTLDFNKPRHRDFFLAKYDQNGKLVYVKTWGRGGEDYGGSLAILPGGIVVVAGISFPSMPNIDNHGCVFIAKFKY